ncbi:MAG: hypothetical protein HZB79_11620 [Deltaproteobacteria bacterium]|nr:hypothetical protein [Deltaproteobacteria bacterium]
MRFSQRIGEKPVKTGLQIGSMDDDLRIALWNAFLFHFIGRDKSYIISESSLKIFYQILWHDFFKLPVDGIRNYTSDTHKVINKWFFNAEWFEVYDFIEFVSNIAYPNLSLDTKKFKQFCNTMMEREISGYRFVGDLITQITNENELKEIEEALENSRKTKLSGVNAHLESALSKLSDRKNPDYRNSVKESISAVESISQIITGNSKATLGEALKTIDKDVEIHGALKKGFDAIYGYTSDEGGIRHAMLEESKVDFEDAKYMFVSCSAFINYLIIKSSKAGIKF